MTDQADRIEALLIEVSAKLDALLSKRGKKPALTEEERTKIHADYGAKFQGDLTAMDFQIDLALQHQAAKKNSNMNLYIRNWLNDDRSNKAPFQALKDKYQKQNMPPRRVKT